MVGTANPPTNTQPPLTTASSYITMVDNHYEEREIFWRQMIIGYYCLHLNSPPETSYKTEERCNGWYGDDVVISHIMVQFGLVA
jgi:hypothetical protein